MCEVHRAQDLNDALLREVLYQFLCILLYKPHFLIVNPGEFGNEMQEPLTAGDF
jgi:hypothetical protein